MERTQAECIWAAFKVCSCSIHTSHKECTTICGSPCGFLCSSAQITMHKAHAPYKSSIHSTWLSIWRKQNMHWIMCAREHLCDARNLALIPTMVHQPQLYKQNRLGCIDMCIDMCIGMCIHMFANTSLGMVVYHSRLYYIVHPQ